MGTSDSRVRIVNNRLDWRSEKINIDELDSLFSDAFPLVKEIELCRCEFLLRWNEFKRLTGAIILLNPRFECLLEGMLYKIAADMNGTLNSIQFFETEPFIKHTLPLKSADEALIRSFRELCRYYLLNNERIYRLEAELQKYHLDIKGMLRDPESMLTDTYNVAPMNVRSYTRKMTLNAKKMAEAYACVQFIRTTFDDMRKGLNRYASLSNLPLPFRSFETIGAEASRKKIDKATSIMYKYTREEKVSNFEDHYDFVNEDMKAEKEARFVLDEILREPQSRFGLKTLLPVLREKNVRLPTGFSTISGQVMETAASGEMLETEPTRTEKIRMPIETGVSISQPIEVVSDYEWERRHEPEISNEIKIKSNNNGKLISGAEKRYDQSFVQSRYTTETQPQIVTSQSTIQGPSTNIFQERIQSTSQAPFTNQGLTTTQVPFTNQSLTTTQVPFTSQGFTTTQVPFTTSQGFTTTQLPITSQGLTTTQDLTTSQVPITQVSGTMTTQSHQLPSFLQKAVATGKIDYNYLLNQIESLQRQNEELQTKLSLSQSSFFQQQPSTTEKFEIPKSPKPTIERLPIYIKNHIPLRSWNFVLKNSVTVSDQQKVKCIESSSELDMIMLGMTNGDLILWRFVNFNDIKEYKVMKISESKIKCIIYLNDTKTLLCGTKDGKLVKCDMNTFECTTISQMEAPIVAIVNPLNGISVLVASGNKIYEIDMINNITLNSIDAHDLDVTGLIYNQQKEIMCSCGKDKSIKVWNAKTKECLGVLQGHGDIIKSICFAYTADHLILCSVANDSFITFWNLSDKNLTRTLKMTHPANKICYSWDKKTVISLHPNGFFNLWNIEKGECKTFSRGEKIYSALDYYDDGHNIFIGTDKGSLEFWNAK